METVVALPERPEAPSHLTDDEAQLWREVVATKPADWFGRDSQPLLAAYCQAVVMHRQLSAMWHAAIERSKGDELNERLAALASIKDLNGMLTKTAGSVAALATKLRLTQQSRYTPQAANTASKKAAPLRPWETAKAG
jgi:phage terminase small subunit